MPKPGVIYFLVNQSMPGLVKVGHTTGEINKRLQQLSNTATPTPFSVAAYFYVTDSEACEKQVHKDLASFRTSPRREFFSGKVADLVQTSLGSILIYMPGTAPSAKHTKPLETEFEADETDIHLLVYLLHDGYETNTPIMAHELAEHHSDYAPLEIEHKLISLAEHDFVARQNKHNEGAGKWAITPKGVKFMFDKKLHYEDLVEEARDPELYREYFLK